MMWSGPDCFRYEALAENLLVAEANRGNAGTVRELGCLYAKGCGPVHRDKGQASRLLEIAVAQFGDKAAAAGLKELEALGDWVDYAVTITLGLVVGGFFLVKQFCRPLLWRLETPVLSNPKDFSFLTYRTKPKAWGMAILSMAFQEIPPDKPVKVGSAPISLRMITNQPWWNCQLEHAERPDGCKFAISGPNVNLLEWMIKH
jgi:hypothetical protein